MSMEQRTQMPVKIEYRRLDDLVPYARNARTHSPAQVDQIAGSIIEWGWTNPILADGTTIVAGHGRALAARKLWDVGSKLRMASGEEIPDGCVPVISCQDWSEAQRKAYILADNRLPLNAGWDEQMLAVELDELREASVDLSLLGFDKQELADLIGTPNFGPGKEGDQGKLDQLEPKTVTCPHCGGEFDASQA